MKRWNWKVFAAVLLCSLLGLLSNKSIESLETALYAGLFLGITFGLIMAYLTREQKQQH